MAAFTATRGRVLVVLTLLDGASAQAQDKKPGTYPDNARAAFASRQLGAPEAGSFSFMLSKQGYLSDKADGPWLPYVMFFVQSGQAMTWGAGLTGSPIIGPDGGPLEPTVLFIPVRRWSDGSGES